MLLRIENSFLQLANKLGKSFSEEDKEKLARFLTRDTKEQPKPTIIELGNIGRRSVRASRNCLQWIKYRILQLWILY